MKPERFCRESRALQRAKKHTEKIVNQLACLPPSTNLFPPGGQQPSNALYRIYSSQVNLQRANTARLQKTNNNTPSASGRLSQLKKITKKSVPPLQRGDPKAAGTPQTSKLSLTWKALANSCIQNSEGNPHFNSERKFVDIQDTCVGPCVSTPAILKKGKPFSQHQAPFEEGTVKMQKKVWCKIAIKKNCGFPFGNQPKREKENFLEGSGMSVIRSAREQFISAESFLELVNP